MAFTVLFHLYITKVYYFKLYLKFFKGANIKKHFFDNLVHFPPKIRRWGETSFIYKKIFINLQMPLRIKDAEGKDLNNNLILFVQSNVVIYCWFCRTQVLGHRLGVDFTYMMRKTRITRTSPKFSKKACNNYLVTILSTTLYC